MTDAALSFRTASVVPAFPKLPLTGAADGLFDAAASLEFFGRLPLEALSLLPGMCTGTGSSVTQAAVFLAAARGTGAATRVVIAGARPSYVQVGQATSDVVNIIRTAFGLSITDLASVLGVERPTIYSWLKDQSTPSASRLDRIGTILRFADTWTAATGGDSRPTMSVEVAGGVSLLNALSQPKVWETEILASLDAQSRAPRDRSRRGRMVAIARENDISARPRSDFDNATARPLAPEI